VIKDGQALLELPTAAPNETKETSTTKTSKKQVSKKQNGITAGTGLSVCVTQLIKDSGIADYHKDEDEITGNNRINNLQELVNAASDYPQSREGLIQFLENIELDRTIEDSDKSGNQQNVVTLITFHNTKGLEFKRVIMTGLDQGVFPREDKKDEELEEERRLFYVGATRAMDELYLTTCKERRMYGRTMPVQPSLFLREIDRSFLQVANSREQITDSSMSRVQRRLPVSNFNPFNLTPAQPKDNDVEERAGWRRGERLFHEDHGHGAVMEVKDSEDGPIVRVRFDYGKETRFLSEIQGRAYEKIGED
jgi:DNA helicase-2/ATP-dependent DNA helicase PcrA